MTFVLTEAKKKFLASEEAKWATEQLQQMVDDSDFNTPTKSFYIRTELQIMSFVEWNMLYLCEHPQIRVQDYLSNLRLKTRLRRSR